MSKRGSKILRKIGYELLDVINKHKNTYKGDPVCEYFIKKRAEGKPYRVAMFAAYNKFLRIYHSRVSKVLNEAEMAYLWFIPFDRMFQDGICRIGQDYYTKEQ